MVSGRLLWLAKNEARQKCQRWEIWRAKKNGEVARMASPKTEGFTFFIHADKRMTVRFDIAIFFNPHGYETTAFPPSL